jgi:hypothetical protein
MITLISDRGGVTDTYYFLIYSKSIIPNKYMR